MRESIFARDLLKIPVIRNVFLALYVVGLLFLVYVASQNDPHHLTGLGFFYWAKAMFCHWFLGFALTALVLAVATLVIYGFLPDHQTQSGWMVLLVLLCGQFLLAVLVGVGFAATWAER